MNVGLYLGSTSKYHEIRIETDEAVNMLLLWHSSNHSNNEDAHCFSSTWAKSRNVPKWECRNDTWQPINQVEYLYMTKGITLCVILQLPSMVNLGIVYNMWHYEDIMRIIILSVWGYNARHPNSHFLFRFSEKNVPKWWAGWYIGWSVHDDSSVTPKLANETSCEYSPYHYHMYSQCH